MKTSNLLIIFLLIVSISSCSKKLTPFTQNLYEKNAWSEEELKQIQFQVSRDIVLRRQLTTGSSEIQKGTIKVVDGRKVDEIIIRKGTPGLLLFMPKENRFAVSFEEGGDGRFLVFGPSSKEGDRYVLLASKWKKNKGEITYEGKKYYTPSESAYATLLVDLKRARKVSLKSRTASGRTVD